MSILQDLDVYISPYWVKHCAAFRPGGTNMLRSSTLKSLDPLYSEWVNLTYGTGEQDARIQPLYL